MFWKRKYQVNKSHCQTPYSRFNSVKKNLIKGRSQESVWNVVKLWPTFKSLYTRTLIRGWVWGGGAFVPANCQRSPHQMTFVQFGQVQLRWTLTSLTQASKLMTCAVGLKGRILAWGGEWEAVRNVHVCIQQLSWQLFSCPKILSKFPPFFAFTTNELQ